MTLSTIAGAVMVVGALIFWVAAVPMPGIYGIQDVHERLAKIAANRRGFVLSQVLFALGAVVTAIGLSIFGLWLAAGRDAILPLVASLAVLIGAGLWAWFMYDRTTDPEGYFGNYSRIPGYVWASAALTSVGLAIFAFQFIGPDRPSWVGYLTFLTVATVIVGALAVPEVVPPQLLYLPPMVMGLALLLIALPAPT